MIPSHVTGILAKTVGSLASLVYPDRCLVCGHHSERSLCGECEASLPLIDGAACAKCGKPTLSPERKCRECGGRNLAFETAVAAGRYEGTLREAIHALKYENGKRLAPQLAKLAACKLESDRSREVDIITFVPMSSDREAKRGYNQAALLAREVAGLLGLRCHPLLTRTKAAKRQSELSLEERKSNVRGLFIARKSIRGRILLVDDVYTTGSTASESASALLRAGAKSVVVSTVARTVID